MRKYDTRDNFFLSDIKKRQDENFIIYTKLPKVSPPLFTQDINARRRK